MKSKIVKCIDCGLDFPKKMLNRRGRCHDCSFKAVRDTMLQLHNKSGPYYESWKKGMKAAAERL